MSAEKQMPLFTSSLQMIRELGAKYLPLYALSLDLRHFALIFCFAESSDTDDYVESLTDILQSISGTLQNYYNVTLRCGIGIPVQTPATICDSYQYARQIFRNTEPKDAIIAFDTDHSQENAKNSFNISLFKNDLTRAFEEYDPDILQTTIQSLCDLFKDHPGEIYAVRNVSPMVATYCDDGAFIASDLTAFIAYNKRYFIVPEYHILTMTADGITLEDLDGHSVEPEYMEVNWDVTAAQKDGYPHFMIKEIHEQPAAITRTITPRIKDMLPDFSEDAIADSFFENVSDITIVACGTAMHAGMVGKYIIEKIARVSVTVDIASEFRYRDPLINEDDLMIVISQSGETADTKAALELAKQAGADTMAIVNVKGSSIAREADMVVYTHAGPEISVASTKAYMVQVSIMYLIAFELAYANGKMDEAECSRYTKMLEEIPEVIEEAIALESKCQFAASKLINADSLLYIGRGLDYALSMEGSLKLKEISYIHSESYAAGELKHGTISLITEQMPVIAIATQKNLEEKTISNIKEVKSRGAFVVLIAEPELDIEDGVADIVIKLPQADQLLMPMVAAVPLQLIAYYTAVLKGNDVDKPRNLAKSVTVE